MYDQGCLKAECPIQTIPNRNFEQMSRTLAHHTVLIWYEAHKVVQR